jgi:hypothetical protein
MSHSTNGPIFILYRAMSVSPFNMVPIVTIDSISPS